MNLGPGQGKRWHGRASVARLSYFTPVRGATMENDSKLTYSVPEVAKVLGISRGLAYDLARRDELPALVIRLGRRMMLSRKSVMALLEAGKPKD